jgi:glyoxylase I family protein
VSDGGIAASGHERGSSSRCPWRLTQRPSAHGRVRPCDCDNGAVSPEPSITGITHVSLSTGDLDCSLAFYQGVLGLPYLVELYEGSVFECREAILLLPSGLGLCLQQHRGNPGASCDARRTGLDHLSFQVDSAEMLEAWSSRSDAFGIEHSGVAAGRLRFDDRAARSGQHPARTSLTRLIDPL